MEQTPSDGRIREHKPFMMQQNLKSFVRASVLSFAYMSASLLGEASKGIFVDNIDGPAVDSTQRALVSSYFKHYNPSIKDATIDKFMQVANAYEFTADSVLFVDCIHQICLESQAKQSARSPSGPIGMGQIAPTTAYDFLHKVGAEEITKMTELGATSMEWAIVGEYSYNDSTHRPYLGKKLMTKARLWLSNEGNNLILWGSMMRANLSHLSKNKAFLRYHLGKLGLERYKGNPSQHEYIVLMSRISREKKEKGV